VVPTHLSTVLFAVAAADPQIIARKLRFTLRLSVILGVPGMLVLGFGAHFALSLFGPGYASAATLPLWLLVIGYLPTIPKMQYIAVCRAAGRIPRAAAVMTAAAVMEVGASAAGGAYGGLKGLSFALLAVYLIEGIILTPPVIRAALGRGRHRQAGQVASASKQPSGTSRPPEGPLALEISEQAKRDLQEAGIAALLLIAEGQAVISRPQVEAGERT